MASALDRLPRAPARDAPAQQLTDAELLARLCRAPVGRLERLLDDNGGLRGLAAEPASVLPEAAGLSGAQAERLVCLLELTRRLLQRPATPGWRVRSPVDVGERMRSAMSLLEREELRVLLLSSKNVVTAVRTVYAGNLAGAPVRVGEVFRDAVRCQAAAIVVVHNHPSGDPSPSADDLRITAELAEAGRLLDVELLDHVVVAADGWVSLRQSATTW
jgi:DNA repair protein RadC